MPTDRHCEKQKQIEAYLMSRIRDSRLRPGARAPSDSELARRFGVSTATSTKALNGLAARGVLERRRGAAGTVVSARLGSMGTIGFIMRSTRISFFGRILNAAADALTARGYAVQLLNPDLQLSSGTFWQAVAESNLVGIISVHFVPPVPLPMPAVLVDYGSSGVCPYPTIASDDVDGGYQVGRHLVEMGHREIVFFSSPPEQITMARRAEGFRRALQESGLRNVHRRLYLCDGTLNDVPALIQRARKDFPGLTAIGTAADSTTARVLRGLFQQKVRVPTDISLTGYGLLDEFYAYLRFTTVDQHPSLFGSRAAEMLIEWLADPAKPPESVVIPCTLIPGETVAHVKRG